MSLEDDKIAARKAGFARRKHAFETQVNTADHLLERALTPHFGKAIAGYMPINTEIDPTRVMGLAAAQGMASVPVILGAGQALKFARWDPQTPMIEGAFKAQIPAELDWITPQVVIVPLVAFDRRGGRLGYGGGFYDRTLEQLRKGGHVLAIGFAFGAQEADQLPLEATDQPLDMIVTDQEIITF